MYDLARFSSEDVARCAAALRNMQAGSFSMEDVASKIVRYLYTQLGDPATGERACGLVRFYKTHNYGELDLSAQQFADRMLGFHPLNSALKCLALLATVGDEPAWNDRQQSLGHLAVPLPSAEAVSQIPMIAQLIKEFGLPIETVVAPDQQIVLGMEQRSYDVFYVPDALNSPHIPAQTDFVVRYGIQSVLGFGGILPFGDLFACILFSKQPIPIATARHFEQLALSVKMAILTFAGRKVFAHS